MSHTVEYDASGNIVVSQAETSIKANACPTCGHQEEIGFRSTRSTPYIFMPQVMGGLLVGLLIIFSHYKVMPAGAFSTQSSAVYSLLMTTPSFVLWLSLYTLQFMGLFDAWVTLILIIAAICITVIVGIYFIEWIQELPVKRECVS